MLYRYTHSAIGKGDSTIFSNITGMFLQEIKGLAATAPSPYYQFERKGFFCTELDSTPKYLVFTLTVPLRDTWVKIEAVRKN